MNLNNLRAACEPLRNIDLGNHVPASDWMYQLLCAIQAALPPDGRGEAKPDVALISHPETGERLWVRQPSPGERAEGREQAGDWRNGARYYRYTDHIAGAVDRDGWYIRAPGGSDMDEPLEYGHDTGDLGMTCVDLALCAHGRLDWGKIQWAGGADTLFVVGPLLQSLDSDEPKWWLRLTPATLDRVLAAVREVGRG